MGAGAALKLLLDTSVSVAPHIGKAKKGLSWLAKLQRLLMKSKGVAGKGKELLKLSNAKPFPNKLINATQRNKLFNTQINNLMLKGAPKPIGGIKPIGGLKPLDTTLPWWHQKNLLQGGKNLLWTEAVTGTGPLLTKPLKKYNEKRKLNTEKQKALIQEENEIAAAQIQMDGDNQLAIQEAEGARIAKERLKRLKLEEKNKKNNNNNKLVIPKEVEKVPVYIPYSERKNKVKPTGKLVIRK